LGDRCSEKNCDNTLSSFQLIPERYGQMDRQTDRQIPERYGQMDRQTDGQIPERYGQMDRQTDGQRTDGQTDRRTELLYQWRASDSVC